MYYNFENSEINKLQRDTPVKSTKREKLTWMQKTKNPIENTKQLTRNSAANKPQQAFLQMRGNSVKADVLPTKVTNQTFWGEIWEKMAI